MKYNQLTLKIMLLLMITGLYCSCKKEAENKAPKANSDIFHLTDTVKTITENPKITEFKAFSWGLDSLDAASATKATVKFKEIFTGQTTSLCDSGFVVFQALYDSLELNLNNIHQNDTTDYEPLLLSDQKNLPKKLKDFQKNLRDNGFKLSTNEGVTFIEQDRNFVAQNFYPLVSPVMKNYLIEIQKENNEGFAIDATISISPRKLVDRVIWYEKFIQENPDFVMIDNCKKYQKAYLTYLLCGYENTKLYKDENNKELSDFFVNAYSYLKSKYSASSTAQLVLPYYNAIRNKQNAEAEKLLKDYHIKGLIFNLK